MSEEQTTRQMETGQTEERQGPLGDESPAEEPQRQGDSPLVTDRGSTSISKTVISRIIGDAAETTEGVRLGSSGLGRGVSIEIGREEVAIDLKVAADYDRSMLQVTEALRHEITERIETLIGLRVRECNITVDDIYFPREESQEQQGTEEAEPRVR